MNDWFSSRVYAELKYVQLVDFRLNYLELLDQLALVVDLLVLVVQLLIQ